MCVCLSVCLSVSFFLSPSLFLSLFLFLSLSLSLSLSLARALALSLRACVRACVRACAENLLWVCPCVWVGAFVGECVNMCTCTYETFVYFVCPVICVPRYECAGAHDRAGARAHDRAGTRTRTHTHKHAQRWSINALPGIYTVAATIRPSAARLAQVLFASAQPSRMPPPAHSSGQAQGRGAADRVSETGGEGTGHAVVMKEGRMSYWRSAGGGDEARGQEDRVEGRGRRTAGGRRSGEDGDDEGVGEEAGLLAHARGEEARGEDEEEETVVLEDVNLVLRRGQFLVICGEVGAGKSTLLAALAQARPLTRGHVTVTGSRAYAGQKAFVMTGSIRDNILFQLSYHKERYADALARAQLLPDLEQLPQGDATVVGTQGVQLSGGQRARVALARVLYADTDVVFLDDVMSALDAHTGAAVWAGALCWLKARGKTVVLCVCVCVCLCVVCGCCVGRLWVWLCLYLCLCLCFCLSVSV